jgi:alanyl-tRNA synthetase
MRGCFWQKDFNHHTNMNSRQVRQTFLDFFKSKQHEIVASAPMVVKNDPTLMFTNAGMNQFKDQFLGNEAPRHQRVADTQKCLRVSGKHNDLEEVGHDTYHHTMFEMLGNWSFGDYFKKEAIEWAWELLTKVYRIPEKYLYVTVFGGDEEEKLASDQEALDYWKTIVDEDHILYGSKKDNFWEMGDTGPCGPCSEIHVDLRSEEDKKKIPGRDLVNRGDSRVIEIWNLVFIEFNRKADGRLESLPARHVDTGMGFERLCMVLQGKTSNYDTDVFQPIIKRIGELAQKEYGQDHRTDVAMRVIADHLRAVTFAIADGQLPSNNKAGYVIRRILRRAVRYGFTFLNFRDPFVCNLVDVLADEMGDYFPELRKQQELITKVIREEEAAFLRTLATGITRFEQHVKELKPGSVVNGTFAFELFDTYGFPVDLTQLMAREKSLEVDMEGFDKGMQAQKTRSRQDAVVDHADWVELGHAEGATRFVGYDTLECESRIQRYRKISGKEGILFQLVLDVTPFYAESGGQAGDKGWLRCGESVTEVLQTLRENNLIVHIVKKLPEDLSAVFLASVNTEARLATARNHSATHLLHAALKEVLGGHVEQKGSLVDDSRLRFDFAHFSKMSSEEILQTERLVNAKIRENIPLKEFRSIPIAEAREMGAVALFGEKYGEEVRVIAFNPDFSVELCGGTHVPATGSIAYFRIVSEAAIAAGIRRIEAVTGEAAEHLAQQQSEALEKLREILKAGPDVVQAAETLQNQMNALQKQMAELQMEKVREVKERLLGSALQEEGIRLIISRVDLDAGSLKNLAFELRTAGEDVVGVLASLSEGKPMLTVTLSEALIATYDAAAIVKTLAREIQGGGGGQKFYATAGGKDAVGLDRALEKAKELILKQAGV